jgi:hypothetical protein
MASAVSTQSVHSCALLQNLCDENNVLLAVTGRPKSLKIAAFLLFGVYAGAPTLAAEITSVIT